MITSHHSHHYMITSHPIKSRHLLNPLSHSSRDGSFGFLFTSWRLSSSTAIISFTRLRKRASCWSELNTIISLPSYSSINSHFMHSSLCFAISELGMSCSQMRQRSKSSFFLSACATHHLVNASLTRSIAFLLKPLSSPLLPLLTAGLHRFQFRVLHHLTIRDLRTQILVILSQ